MIAGAPAMSRGLPSALAVLAFLALVPSGSCRAEVVNRIIATVDGDPITAHEVQRYRAASQAGGEAGEITEEQALEALITDKLLEKEVKDKKIEIRKEEIDRYVDQVKERNRIDSYRFEAALAQQGLSLEAYRERIKGELEKSQLVNREIRGRVSVSPDEVERYYQANKEDFRTGDRATVRDILLRVELVDSEAEIERIRGKAEEVRQLATGERGFEPVAKQFSEGPGADKGGLRGRFERGQLEAQIDAVVFTLAPGQVSPVVRADDGFHILRVDKLEPPGYHTVDEAREQIREVLYQKAVEERFQDWISRDLRERHAIEVFN